MKDASTSIAVLGRLLQMHATSLPTYVANARPWIGNGQRQSEECLNQISRDHQYMAGKIMQRILALGGSPEQGSRFPMEFTDLHDLSLDFILSEVLRYQTVLEKTINECVAKLEAHPESQSIACEAAGMAQGHRELLQELCHTTSTH
ncbi:MAG: hypothetical protein O2931_02380 [Planctomycetota bacterium]|nr:hypothetical protein [Planctomycetota bacterium]MDA1177621.1 hypothetical protein [Planctomycetota bacterium]